MQIIYGGFKLKFLIYTLMLVSICLIFLSQINIASAVIVGSETTESRAILSQSFDEIAPKRLPSSIISNPSLIIKKEIVPHTNSRYFRGDNLSVIVEVANIGKETLHNLRISELVDPGLKLLVPEYDQRTLKSTVIHKNNSFVIYKSILQPEEIFVYRYHIIPNHIGDFIIQTVINTPEIIGINYPMNIKVVADDPKFLVDANLDNLEAIVGKPMEIIFNIKYLGGSIDPYNCTINFDSSENYFVDYIKNQSFNLNQENQIIIRILYTKSGLYSLPRLSIIGSQTKLYSRFEFPITIKATTRLEKYNDLILIFIISIIALIAAITGAYFSKKSEREWMNQRRRLTEELEIRNADFMNKYRINKEISKDDTTYNCSSGWIDRESTKK